MKVLLTLTLAFFLTVSANAQLVIERSESGTSKKDGSDITTYEGKPFTGFLIENYANGKPKSWITMKDGLANGAWQEWLENGNLRFDSNWKDGKAQGLWKYFHDNGVLKYEESYVMDISNGISRTYYNNGQLEHDFLYLNGKKHGIWSYYSETGVLLKQEIYENDELISTTEETSSQ